MSPNLQRLGWIGLGRMGAAMAERLLDAGYNLSVWNRTRSKAEPLLRKGATLVNRPSDLADVDVVFTMVSTGNDLEEIYFSEEGVLTRIGSPRILVDSSTIAVAESARLRSRITERGSDFIAAPVSGNAKVITAGKLSSVVSGPKAAFDVVEPLIRAFAPQGVSYVGDGELARVCKIAHNVMLGVVIENLIEVTLLANKMGVPRHAFLAFINNSVMGSMFTRYKTPALVNVDWTTTFTPELMRKDLDLGLELGRLYEVSMPVTATTREVLQSHIGSAMTKSNMDEILASDFAMMAETLAEWAGTKLRSEGVEVGTGM